MRTTPRSKPNRTPNSKPVTSASRPKASPAARLRGQVRRGAIYRPTTFLCTLLVLLSLVGVQAAHNSNRSSSKTPAPAVRSSLPVLNSSSKRFASNRAFLKAGLGDSAAACGPGEARVVEPHRQTVTRQKTALGQSVTVTSNYPLSASTNVNALVSSKLRAKLASGAQAAAPQQVTAQDLDEGGPDPTPRVEATSAPTPTVPGDGGGDDGDPDPDPDPDPEPCGVYRHGGWISGVVTWRPDANGDPTATISSATEICSWIDTCASTSQPSQNHTRSYSLLSSGVVAQGSGWVMQYNWRANPGCSNGLPTWATASHPMPRHWVPAPSMPAQALPLPEPIEFLPCHEGTVSVAVVVDRDTWTVNGGGNGVENKESPPRAAGYLNRECNFCPCWRCQGVTWEVSGGDVGGVEERKLLGV